MNATLAATMRMAPATSRRCGRSCLGSFRSRSEVSRSARIPSGMLSQKIADQCT